MNLVGHRLCALYDPLFEPPLRPVRRAVRPLVEEVGPRRVLNVRSGTGTQIRAPRERGDVAFGADLSPEMLRLA